MLKSDYLLLEKGEYTEELKSFGVNTWLGAIDFIRQLPYGRNSDRKDLKLVLKENKGTCSSKHALLKQLANLNNISNVRLFMGIYRMNGKNTPGVRQELAKSELEYIPEAHCYLKQDDLIIDCTTANSTSNSFVNDLIEEQEIQPFQVFDYKVEYHKMFLKNWLQSADLSLDLEGLWKIRERCIRALS